MLNRKKSLSFLSSNLSNCTRDKAEQARITSRESKLRALKVSRGGEQTQSQPLQSQASTSLRTSRWKSQNLMTQLFKKEKNSLNLSRTVLPFFNCYLDIRKHNELPPTTLDYYKYLKLVGKGAFGKVTLGLHKLTGKQVAIKTIEKSYMKDDFSRRKVF